MFLLCNVHKLFLTDSVYRSHEAGDNSFDALKRFTSSPVTRIHVIITQVITISSTSFRRGIKINYIVII